MQNVADSFANSVNFAVEVVGIMSFHTNYENKYSSLYNMDQTAVFIDHHGKLTVDSYETRNIDIVHGAAENTGRCSSFGCMSVEHTEQEKKKPDLASKCHRVPHATFGQSKTSQDGKHSRNARDRVHDTDSVHPTGCYYPKSANGCQLNADLQEEDRKPLRAISY
ncbi:hypothetical protein PPTG_21933 [Phytophthora nicotianae INRA-310]|uniref:Uncharacterized protein n=2 Tax=Phytophthora nicotianae TaxID=4792 RepID=W2QQA9_PHYN3|nr:hypothetical protein PPTG_21933 [Phytophthora nicotianae INRA-310]ETN15377.1 hypothetical protein PPTG_21933 [Phytophthora nicotianae INRA-310]